MLVMSSVLFALSELLLPLSLSVKVVVAPVLSGVLLKLAAPVAAPLGMVVLKPKSWSLPRGSVCLMIFTWPQLETCTGIGAMKSFSAEVNDEPEERLFR